MKKAGATGFPVVGIGASAGGIKALKQFFQRLPADSGMAFVVVMHLSPEHESVLDEILQSSAKIPVHQVTKTIAVEANHVYVIPPASNLVMEDGHLKLIKRAVSRGPRSPIDLFFRTLAEAYGMDAFAVVLSGAGSDGVQGLARIKEYGGFVLAQKPMDAEYDSMPRSAIATGMVDIVLPAGKLAGKIISIRRLEEKLKSQAGGEIERDIGSEANAKILREVLTLLRVRTGHDFSNYKRPTLLRRIARRLQLNEVENISAYFDFLAKKPEEIQLLLRDLLISVTNFFRDKEAFQYLETDIIPRLFEGKTGSDTVRVWSCGCATGEEAYSLSMLLHEYSANLPDPPSIQVFASDINEDAIRLGRDCLYSEAITADVSLERIRRFFTRKGDQFCVNKELRDSVLFAPHNVLRDPPFSHLDLIACRNLLIYLNREMQERLMEIFNFAIRPGGYLFLGSSEAAENYPSLFLPIDKKQRVYQSIGSERRTPSVLPHLGKWEIKVPDLRGSTPQPFSFSAIHHMAAERYAPPSILVNEDYDIMHMSDRAGRFLQLTGGEPSRNILKMAHPSLQLDLRAALMTAKQDNRQAEFRNIKIRSNEEDKQINMIVRPVEIPNSAARYFLIIFDDERRAIAEEGTEAVFAALAGDAALEAIVRRLEEELQQTRERLRATFEQGETSNEELKASNEELQAINEELRSATEELETSKEELQSLNEELTTVNQELKEKIEEVSEVNADLQNLMQSTNIGTIFLDRNLCIKRYTRRIEELFNIISSDLGRPVGHLTHSLDYDDLSKDALQVLANLRTIEREVHRKSGNGSYLVRLSPYRTVEDRIDGVVVSFVEITELKTATERLQEADRRKNEFLATLAHELRNPLAPICNGLELMRTAPNKEAMDKARQILERQVAQIVHLVDDLLDIARITQGKIHLRKKRINLCDAIRSALEASRPFMESFGHKVEVSLPDSPIYLSADFTRVSQIFLNLLNNAAKYTKSGGHISLTMETEGSQAVVRVRDTGVGISQEMLPQIFNIFTQVDQLSERPQTGLGIGLSLVKNLVEMHGGIVTASSAGENQGSEFVVQLPLTTEATSPSSAQTPSSSSMPKQSRILIVDDNVDAGDMLNILLTAEGHSVTIVRDGKSALEAAEKFHPKVVLLDIGLPDIDGYEVAKRLRKKQPNVQLIAVSGWGQEEDRRRSKEAGFDHHLIKPTTLEQIVQLLGQD